MNYHKLPLVTPSQHNALIDRLSERLSHDETVQVEKTMPLKNITVHGSADVLRSDAVWQIEYRNSLRPEDYLQATMNAILFCRPHCILWNTRNNEIYKVSIEGKKRDMFLAQVYRVITKQKSNAASTNLISPVQHCFRIGETVHHRVFGTGVITDIRQTLRQNIADVKFAKYGLKTLVVDYLEPIM